MRQSTAELLNARELLQRPGARAAVHERPELCFAGASFALRLARAAAVVTVDYMWLWPRTYSRGANRPGMGMVRQVLNKQFSSMFVV